MAGWKTCGYHANNYRYILKYRPLNRSNRRTVQLRVLAYRSSSRAQKQRPVLPRTCQYLAHIVLLVRVPVLYCSIGVSIIFVQYRTSVPDCIFRISPDITVFIRYSPGCFRNQGVKFSGFNLKNSFFVDSLADPAIVISTPGNPGSPWRNPEPF